MKFKWSMQHKMTSFLIAFGVIPLCIIACLMLYMRWDAHVTETVLHNQYVFDNIEADAQMLALQTESVIRTLANCEELANMLSKDSKAAWSIDFNDNVKAEISKAENYLSSLNANIIIIFDRDDIALEHWYTLLNAERFASDESYRDFIDSESYSGWFGVSRVLPDSLAGVYDYREWSEKFTYYCCINTGVSSNLGVIKCAVDSAPFIETAQLRAEGSALYIMSNESMLFAADDAYTAEPFLGGCDEGECIRFGGSLWQRRYISSLDLQIVIRTEIKALMLEYLNLNSGTILLTVAAIFLLFFIAQHVLASMLMRFKRIAAAADSINAKDGRVHLPEDGNDEVGNVVRAFNSLFDRLDRQMAETMHREKEKRHMQALALQYQLNPHFLFNSLLWLQMELEEQNIEPRIIRSITRLGSVLRYNLSESLQATLAQETEHLQAYIDFMCEMKRQHITLKMQLDPELEGVTIPRFMLQPLVENALQHGLIYGKDMQITVQAQKIEQWMRFSIANDGRMIDALQLEKLQKSFVNPGEGGRGVGIHNLVQRLRLKYADQFAISVSSDAQKTEFCIRIPLEKERGSHEISGRG